MPLLPSRPHLGSSWSTLLPGCSSSALLFLTCYHQRSLPRTLRTSKMPSVDIKYPRTDFPEDLECHPLLVVDFAKVKAGDEAEIDQLYNACTNLGFFYLKNHGIDDLTEPMFEMGKSTFSLPAEELLPFEQGEYRERQSVVTLHFPLPSRSAGIGGNESMDRAD